MLLFAFLVSLGLCRRRRSVSELISSGSRIMEMNMAREAAAAYSNQLFAADSGLNEDIGNFDAADCHCYPCEASPEDLKGQEMTTLSEKMKSQQAKLAKLTSVAAQISEKRKKRDAERKQPRNRRRGLAAGRSSASDLETFDDEEFMDEDLEDENSMERDRGL